MNLRDRFRITIRISWSSLILTNLKIQPIERESLDKTEDSFAKEAKNVSERPCCVSRVDIIRIDPERCFILKQKSNHGVSKHKCHKSIGSFGC